MEKECGRVPNSARPEQELKKKSKQITILEKQKTAIKHKSKFQNFSSSQYHLKSQNIVCVFPPKT